MTNSLSRFQFAAISSSKVNLLNKEKMLYKIITSFLLLVIIAHLSKADDETPASRHKRTLGLGLAGAGLVGAGIAGAGIAGAGLGLAGLGLGLGVGSAYHHHHPHYYEDHHVVVHHYEPVVHHYYH